MRVGANMDVEELLDQVGTHMWTDFKFSIRVKGLLANKDPLYPNADECVNKNGIRRCEVGDRYGA